MSRLASALLILGAAFALRFYRINHQSFWNDEGNSARIAERSTEQIIAGAAADIHPPGYYFALAGWRALTGWTELSLRGFSALAGLLLVALLVRLGTDWFGSRAGLFAAALGTLNPFLIYYSQEARMYALAAVLGAAVFWVSRYATARRRYTIAYVLLAAAGMYTHYSFVFVLLALNIGQIISQRRDMRRLGMWLLLQLAALLLYLPWLPTAWRQITIWPAGRAYLPILNALAESWRWLIYGPTAETQLVAPGLVALAALALAGLLSRKAFLPAVWLAFPVTLTLVLGLFSPVFAKFLLVAAPALCLLAGNGLAHGLNAAQRAQAAQDRAQLFFYSALTITLALTWFRFDLRALNNLYSNPTYFRADYRAMAASISSDARPGDAVLLNAPNQWEVFTYYQPDDSNVFPVARTRPLDVPAQIAELENIAASHDRLFTLYWGDAQSDPGRVIEGWLNDNTFKAYDRWYGDVRLATYAVPAVAATLETPTTARFGEHIQLEGFTLNAEAFSPGDILQLTLFWQTNAALSERYKVFVHVSADAATPPVAQQDGEPGGGLELTTTWPVDQSIADNHGVLLASDLPSGEYLLSVGLYGVEDGMRLDVHTGEAAVSDRLELARIRIEAP